MKFYQVGPTFLIPGKTVNFFGVKFFVTSFILKVRKSKKNQHVWIHTYMCIRENVTGGAHCAPPPALNRVNRDERQVCDFVAATFGDDEKVFC